MSCMKKIALLLALMLAMTMVMTGCQATATTTTEPTAAPAAASTAPATVNGVEVSADSVAMIAENLMYQYSQYGYDTTDESFIASVNQYALEYAVQLEVMLQKAKEKGLDQFTEEEMAAMQAERG